MARDSYTRYPRSILWLIAGGVAAIGGDEPNAQPCFEVEVAPFYLSKWPITNEQFLAFDPAFRPAPVSPGPRHPAAGVSFVQASAYCRWWAGISRKPIRLPTEIEWEHACRAGSTAANFWGADESAAGDFLWDKANWAGGLEPLERRRANGAGLHGMLGSLWEWTGSRPQPYPLRGSATHGSGDLAGDDDREGERVLRGGSFRVPRGSITCSLRRAAPVDLCADDVGFRIARSFA